MRYEVLVEVTLIVEADDEDAAEVLARESIKAPDIIDVTVPSPAVPAA